MNSKGSMQDLFYIMIISVAVVFIGFILFKVNTSILSQLEISINATPNETIMIDNAEDSQDVLLNVVPVIVLSSGLGSIISALFIPSSIIFLPISIISLLFFIILSTFFSEIMWTFINSTSIISIANNYPVIVGMIQNYPLVILVIGSLLIIVMYSFRRGVTHE